jgi:alkanesulfonate monooxygenase SsuD/methylene tetrahydromethanopterin reductase-like flavin-dependent oxidoreductase (luciferase family)
MNPVTDPDPDPGIADATDARAEVSLAYDMRAPEFGTPAPRLYRSAIEQCAWADKRGFAGVTLSEHHGSDDGYLPSPIVLGAAIGGATARLLIRLSVVLLPLYHPVRLAEDLAVLDLACNGRLRLTVAAGYRPEEYEQFAAEFRRRPSLMEQGIDVLKQAWTGEPFELDGRTVRVTPRPAQTPRPSITLGGASPATARRAARIADDYAPLADRLYELYLEALAELGRPAPAPPRRSSAGNPVFVHVSEDPDRDWAVIAPHALHESNSYAAWAAGARGSVYTAADDADELRSTGRYVVVTPEEAVTLARRQGVLTLKPLLAGLDPDVGWAGLELVDRHVLPHLQAPTSSGGDQR